MTVAVRRAALEPRIHFRCDRTVHGALAKAARLETLAF